MTPNDHSAVVPADATDLLRRLAGQEVSTITGRRNRILDVGPPHVVVATDRSPNGQQIPIAEVQSALDTLRLAGRVMIHPTEIGYRSAFIGAVLRTLPSATTGTCALYPARLLVAAHIKPRSSCSEDERRDLTHIAMPVCLFGCDALFETGYISVVPAGTIVTSALEIEGPLAERLAHLAGRRCLAFTEHSRPYFEWHLARRFRG